MTDAKSPDEKEIEEMVDNISDWLSKQPHLPHIEDKKLLTKFLINCKFRLQQTKDKIDNYYSARTNFPSIFQNRDPSAPEIRTSAQNTLFFPLRQPAKNGHKICMIKHSGSPEDFIPEDYVKRMFMVFDIMFLEEASSLEYIVVVDFRGFSFRHFLKLSTVAKQFMEIVENVIPAKLKSVHYINAPSFVDKVVELFKMLVKPKMRERFYIHSHIETFQEFVGDRDILPSDIGGKEPPFAELNDQWQKYIESYKSWFEEQEQIRSNEDLRPSNSKSSWLMGTEGSFKKLAVD